MTDINLRYVGILAQGFAIFVAISTLLGRIYYLSYFDSLGIQSTEFRAELTEYSIISPEVTILGIGYSTIVAVYFLFPWHSASIPCPWWAKLLLGAILALLGATPLIDPLIASALQPDLNIMLVAMLFLSKIALMLFGSAIFIAGLSFDRPQDERVMALRRIIMPLFVVMYIGVSIWLMAEFSSTIGRADAQTTLMKAPIAQIEVATSNGNDGSKSNLGELPDDAQNSYFKVVIVGERFAYLLPTTECQSTDEGLYSIPLENIVKIDYISEQINCTEHENPEQ